MKKTRFLLHILILLLLIACSKSDNDAAEVLPQVMLPTIKTLEANDITENSATLGGNISDDGGSPITERGVCWATTNSPTIKNNFNQNGTGKGSFTTLLKELNENTWYYVRAYATNEKGIIYGDEISFTTLEKPPLVYEGNVTLNSQEMIDEFALNNFSEITGDLTIGYNVNQPELELINNLDKLSHLTTIGGSLFIYGTANLTSSEGLANISWIGGNIEIIGTNMPSITFLENIKEYNGSLTLRRLGSLRSLAGLENCTKINGDLIIDYNPDLIEIDALTNITSVIGRVSIEYNPSLSNLNGLSSLKDVNRFLSIYKNDVLTDISGLHSLETVKWMLSIEHCPLLTNINGLNNLFQVQGIEINDNDALSNLDGLEHVLSVNGITESLAITNNSSLIDINVLALNTEVIKSIQINRNDNLTDLSGLKNLKSIEQLAIEGNNSLTEITGLNNLQSVTQALSISNNDNLISISGFEAISSFEGRLTIWYNRKLSDLCGLTPIFQNGLQEDKYGVDGNAYNPSYQDFFDGKCN